MSTLKVNKIENTATTDGGIEIDNTGHVQIDGVQLPTAGPLSNRNLIINGAMAVTQRTSASTAIVDDKYLVQDRMQIFDNNDGSANLESDTDVPAGEGFTKSLKWDVTSADTSIAPGQYAAIDYRIEGLDNAQLCYGTAQAKTIAVSFWAKSTLTGPFCYAVRNSAINRSFIREFNFAAADTWERITLTIPGDTGGTWLETNGRGAMHQISLSMGSDFQSTADSWNSDDGVATSNQVNLMGDAANDFYLTGWQVEVGSKVTPFEHRSFGDELARCQRYYQKSFDYETAPGSSTTQGTIQYGYTNMPAANYVARFGAQFRASMRAQPTVVTFDSAGNSGKCNYPDSSTNQSFTIILRSENNFSAETSSLSNSTDARIYFHYTAEAEL